MMKIFDFLEGMNWNETADLWGSNQAWNSSRGVRPDVSGEGVWGHPKVLKFTLLDY